MDGASVYILCCADGSLYVGVTRRSVDERVSEHEAGLTIGYTTSRRPVELLYSEHHERIDEAVAAERRIKGWSRAKKVAYMAGEFEALRAFSVSRGTVLRRGGASFDTGAARPAQDEEGVEREGGGLSRRSPRASS